MEIKERSFFGQILGPESLLRVIDAPVSGKGEQKYAVGVFLFILCFVPSSIRVEAPHLEISCLVIDHQKATQEQNDH